MQAAEVFVRRRTVANHHRKEQTEDLHAPIFPQIRAKSTQLRALDAKLVELSGNCPPSPKSLAGIFSRLSFDFSLPERLLETGISFVADP